MSYTSWLNYLTPNQVNRGQRLTLFSFLGKMKNVLEENEELIVKLSEDEGCSAKLRVEMEKIKSELFTTKQQNDSLIKKCALKQDKVEEILKVYESRGE